MLVLHQLHRVLPGREGDFEALHRDRWLPAVASVPGCRFAWYGVPTPIARFGDEVATITVINDAAADGFFSAVRDGSLAALAAEIRSHRTGSETRLMRPI